MIQLAPSWVASALGGGYDPDTDDFSVLLMQDDFVYDESAEFVSDLIGTEVSVAGYVRVLVPPLKLSVDLGSTPSKVRLEGVTEPVDIVFPSLPPGQTVSAVVIYQGGIDPGGDGTSKLVGTWQQAAGQPGLPYALADEVLTLRASDSGIASVEVR